LKTDDLHDEVVGRWFKQQNWNRILTTVRREILFRPGVRHRWASSASGIRSQPPGGPSCKCQNAPRRLVVTFYHRKGKFGRSFLVL